MPNIKGTARAVPQHDSFPPLTPEYENPPAVPKVELVTSESYNKYLIICVALVLVVLVVAVAYMATKGGWGKKEIVDRIVQLPAPPQQSTPQQSTPKPILKTEAVERAAAVRRGQALPVEYNASVNTCTDESTENVESPDDDESDEEEYVNLKSKKEKSIIDEVSALDDMVNTSSTDTDIIVNVPKYVRDEASKCEDEDVRVLASEKVHLSQVSKLVGDYNNAQFNKWVNNKTMQKLLHSSK
jgi:hypothetical protein